MAGLYVDLDDTGLNWKRPTEQVTRAEAKKLLADSANDYAGQYDRMTNLALLQELDPDLSRALKAWKQRGKVPRPAFL